MDDKPEAESTEHSIEELVTGVGKLVYKLNESVVNIDKRLENLEKNLSSILKENIQGVTDELVKANEFLSGMAASEEAAPEKQDEEEAAKATEVQMEGLIEKLDELKEEVSGVRSDLGSAEEKLLKALAEGPEDAVGKELLSKSLEDVSVTISESAKSIQDTVMEVIEKSDTTRGEVLAKNIEILSGGIGEISAGMDKAKESIQEKLKEIQTGTAEEVAAITGAVKESAEDQKRQLEDMKGLLSLHSVEVKDNHVRELNRMAIVHFNNAEYDQALLDLTEALELSPESSELLANMAHIEAYQGNLKKAEDHFRKALEITPDLEPAISGLGAVMVMSGRPGDTIDFLQKHLEEGTDASTGILIAMSRAYASQDNHAKALSLLEQAEKITPGHPELEQELAKYRD